MNSVELPLPKKQVITGLKKIKRNVSETAKTLGVAISTVWYINKKK